MTEFKMAVVPVGAVDQLGSLFQALHLEPGSSAALAVSAAQQTSGAEGALVAYVGEQARQANRLTGSAHEAAIRAAQGIAMQAARELGIDPNRIAPIFTAAVALVRRDPVMGVQAVRQLGAAEQGVLGAAIASVFGAAAAAFTSSRSAINGLIGTIGGNYQGDATLTGLVDPSAPAPLFLEDPIISQVGTEFARAFTAVREFYTTSLQLSGQAIDYISEILPDLEDMQSDTLPELPAADFGGYKTSATGAGTMGPAQTGMTGVFKETQGPHNSSFVVGGSGEAPDIDLSHLAESAGGRRTTSSINRAVQPGTMPAIRAAQFRVTTRLPGVEGVGGPLDPFQPFQGPLSAENQLVLDRVGGQVNQFGDMLNNIINGEDPLADVDPTKAKAVGPIDFGTNDFRLQSRKIQPNVVGLLSNNSHSRLPPGRKPLTF